MLAGPKNLATSPAVGGTVDRKVRPITAAKTSTTGPVFGASRNTSTATRAGGIEQRQQRLHAPAAHRPADAEAADDVEQADHRQRPGAELRRQLAGRDHARQVRGQEGDVEAADEEAGRQQPEAAVAPAPRAWPARALSRAAPRPRAAARRAAQHPGRRQGQQHEERQDLQRAGPADGGDQHAGDRREQELAERAAGVDDAGGHAALARAGSAGWSRPSAPRARPCRRRRRPARRWRGSGPACCSCRG